MGGYDQRRRKGRSMTIDKIMGLLYKKLHIYQSNVKTRKEESKRYKDILGRYGSKNIRLTRFRKTYRQHPLVYT
jgi:hypothetical protein